MDLINWISLRDLKAPFNDALNYRSRQDKEFFSRVFVRTEALQKCLAPTTYFLMGEKGTGKTAYAVYLENNSVDGSRSQVITMTETQYKRFIELKRQGKLSYSDYSNIWRSMLLFLVARMLVAKSKGLLHSITGKFRHLEAEIERWGKNALNPEIETAFEAITTDSISGRLGSREVGELGAKSTDQQTENYQRITHHLLQTEGSLKEAIASLSLSANHILFIDGIDYRPESISYRDYIDCVKGLGEAIWQLNTEYFNQIRDSKGRIKVVLLVRPDVFHALNLYNSNSRLQDNTVFLDWSTTEREFHQSALFDVSGKYFAIQQKHTAEHAAAWAHYCENDRQDGEVFRRLLKFTFQKPRDLLTFIKIARDISLAAGRGADSRFLTDITRDAAFTRAFSDYLLGEVKNYAAFYMTQDDFSQYMKFFQYLDGKSRFSYDEFAQAHERFRSWADGEHFDAKDYLRDPEAMLQLLYDVNLVGYAEHTEGENQREVFFHFSYRERTLVNIAPKVKATRTLILNSGIAKALDIGRAVRGDTAARGAAAGVRKRRGRRGSRR